jgi:hypothetical protein
VWTKDERSVMIERPAVTAGQEEVTPRDPTLARLAASLRDRLDKPCHSQQVVRRQLTPAGIRWQGTAGAKPAGGGERTALALLAGPVAVERDQRRERVAVA